MTLSQAKFVKTPIKSKEIKFFPQEKNRDSSFGENSKQFETTTFKPKDLEKKTGCNFHTHYMPCLTSPKQTMSKKMRIIWKDSDKPIHIKEIYRKFCQAGP